MYYTGNFKESMSKEYETCYYSIKVANYCVVAPGVISAFHLQIPITLQVYIQECWFLAHTNSVGFQIETVL